MRATDHGPGRGLTESWETVEYFDVYQRPLPDNAASLAGLEIYYSHNKCLEDNCSYCVANFQPVVYIILAIRKETRDQS